MFQHMGEDYLPIVQATLTGNVLKYISYFIVLLHLNPDNFTFNWECVAKP